MTKGSGEKGNFERVGAAMGGVAGKMTDTAVDLMSSMLRTAAGTFGGWWARNTPDDARKSFTPEADQACRDHFENVRRAGRTNRSYESMRPLYQFGHLAGSNPDYQGRSFEEVEGDLQQAWTPEYTTAFGEWNTIRDYVNTGYSTHSRGGNLP